MKILKIELQNINSLKAEQPIVIDFESKHFTDVGLFAITGSTGAGKTTLLDAITIALYHTAPRFNGQNKAGLEDAVSYGADFALSRITFINKNEKYEAFWSIRTATKAGKKLSTAKEEVRLKNLSSGKILAEKKTEVKTQIEAICQLNYEQFLRSVMLAQGEFAAFLSASAQEKGKLLEQITGEDIYRKIGESINGKIYEEGKTLESIRAKVNNEDLLNEEQRQLLKLELLELSEKQKGINNELQGLQKTLEWNKKWIETIQQEEQLSKDKNQFIKAKKEKDAFLKSLELHDKAKPFQKQIETLNRNQHELKEKQLRLTENKVLTQSLNQHLKEKISQEKEAMLWHEKSKQTLTEWQPKLELVSTLDANLVNIQNNLVSEQKNADELQAKTKLLEANSQDFPTRISTLESERNKVELFLKEKAAILKVEPQLNQINALLQQRISIHSKLKEYQVNKKEAELSNEQCLIEVADLKKQETESLAKQQEIKTQLSTINTQVGQQSIPNLLDKKEILNKKMLSISQASMLCKNHSEASTHHEETYKALGEINSEIIRKDKDFATLSEQKLMAEQAVGDAEKLLQQEQQIIKYEADRQKLLHGEACPLCGSNDHPYVEHYQSSALTDGEKELAHRKEKLFNLDAKHKELAIEIEKTKNLIEANQSKLKTFHEQKTQIKNNFDKLSLAIEVGQSNEILILEREIKEQNEKADLAIQNAQAIAEKQKGYHEVLGQLNANHAIIETKRTNLIDKEKQTSIQIEELLKKMEQSSESIIQIERNLKQGLEPLDMEIPAKEKSDAFVEQLSNQIKTYHEQNQYNTKLKSDLEKLSIEKQNVEKQLSENTRHNEKNLLEINRLNKELKEQQNKRIVILPQSVSVQSKRNELEKEQVKSKEAFEIISEKLTATKQEIAVLDHTIKNLNDEVDQLSINIKSDSTLLTDKLAHTVFNTIDELAMALLDNEQESKIRDIKTRIEAQHVKLETLYEKLTLSKAALTTTKPEHEKLEFAEKQLEQLEFQKTNMLKREGEIKKQFELDNQIIARNKGVFNEIKIQEKTLTKWSGLMNLLGGSKHAFNTYVQRLTLQQLVHLANIHLFSLNQRYSLKLDEKYRKGEELSFKLVDHYQTDQVRYVDTCSGGEKFLISLALALGLSDLASKHVQIDSLFIDEGFGTLDAKTLDTVIASLETLQAQGKTIGIISHVENLKERIPTQIEVIKKSNGVSEVEIR